MSVGAPARYLDDLSAWVIDQQQHVSYRWLAQVLAVDVDAAKRMLYEFCQLHKELWCTYLVAGHTKKDDYAIKVVPSKQLEETKEQFAKIHSVHVYSVAPQATESAATQLASADNDQLKKALTDANGEALRTNSLGRIQFSGLQIREPGRRQVQIAKMEEASSDPVRSASLPKQSTANKEKDNKLKRPATVGAFFSQQQSKKASSKKKASDKPSADSQPSDESQPTDSQATGDNVDSQEVPMAVADEQPSTEAAAPKQQPAAGASVATATGAEDSDEEQEWDDGSAPTHARASAPTRQPSRPKPKAAAPAAAKKESSPAKRQREPEPGPEPELEPEPEPQQTTKVEQESEQAADEPSEETVQLQEQEEDATAAAAETKPRKRGRKKKVDTNGDEDEKPKETPKVFGAMDNFMAESDTSKSSTTPRRVKRKKMVERTYMDEKGYLVTENVMEEVSEDEAEVPPPAPAPAPAAKPAKTASKASASKPAASASQRSISSFFGKK